jgi:hypothetical protein
MKRVSVLMISKMSLGAGEVVHIESEMFHSANEVKFWIVESMGSDSAACPDYF